MSKCLNFNKLPCNFKDTFFKIDAISLVDVANKSKQEAAFWQIFNERRLLKVSFFDEMDTLWHCEQC